MLGALPPVQPTDGPPLLGFNPLSKHDWEHLLDSIGDKIKGQMNDLGKQILSGIVSAGKTAISGVTKAQATVPFMALNRLARRPTKPTRARSSWSARSSRTRLKPLARRRLPG